MITINIDSSINVNEFYKNLSKYKRSNETFKIIVDKSINNKKELLDIEKILNTKNDYERLKLVYRSICNYMDYYIDNNICEFDNNGLCIAQRMNKEKSIINGCCGRCIYLNKNGCNINSISCKLFYCNYLKTIKEIPTYKNLVIYKYFLTYSQKLLIKYLFFMDEEESLKKLYHSNILTFIFLKDKKMERL